MRSVPIHFNVKLPTPKQSNTFGNNDVGLWDKVVKMKICTRQKSSQKGIRNEQIRTNLNVEHHLIYYTSSCWDAWRGQMVKDQTRNKKGYMGKIGKEVICRKKSVIWGKIGPKHD